MSVVAEETFAIPKIIDNQSLRIKHLIHALGNRFDPGECRLYRNLQNVDYPLIVVRLVNWYINIRIKAIEISITEGLAILCNDKEFYQLDAKTFRYQSQGIVDKTYRILLYGKEGYSSFLIEL